jgi:hypothetical protein
MAVSSEFRGYLPFVTPAVNAVFAIIGILECLNYGHDICAAQQFVKPYRQDIGDCWISLKPVIVSR